MAKRPKIKGLARTEPAAEMPPVVSPPVERKKSPYVRGSLYLKPAVHQQLRKLSYELNRSQHELIQEAIDMLLARYAGKTRQELEAQNTDRYTG